jgi:hypothetical protein
MLERIAKPRKIKMCPIYQNGSRAFLLQWFVMTFKKSNRTGQSILEYFILTAVVMGVVLFFSNSTFFNGVRNSCQTSFSSAVTAILKCGK